MTVRTPLEVNASYHSKFFICSCSPRPLPLLLLLRRFSCPSSSYLTSAA